MTSRRSYAGKRALQFENERALLTDLAHSDLGLDESFPTTLIRLEVPVGGCIPDLVCVRFSRKPARELWPRRWGYRHAYILWLLRRWRRLHLKTIAARIYECPEKVEPVLHALVKSGAIVVKPTGAFSLSVQMETLRAEVISAETKLCRWKDALKQAQQYRHFSDRVFVAMDPNGTPTTSAAIEVFRRSRIGLCAVDSPILRWVIQPQPLPLGGPNREYLISAAASSRGQSLWSVR